MSRKTRGTAAQCDVSLRVLLNAAGLVSGCVAVAVLVFLAHGAWPALESGLLERFLLDTEWRPGSKDDPRYGLAPMLAGTLAVTSLAGIFAIPPGVCGAVLSQFYLPESLGKLADRSLELLAGVPSVIFGFWGLTMVVPAINRIEPPGQSLLAASIVLALMILPTIGLASRAAFRAMDPEILRNAAALGLSRPTIVLRVVFPTCRSGIGAGIILALTRAIGETLAVVMVCGNIPRFPESIFDPVRPVTATIALEMGYASSDHKAFLYLAGLFLMLVTGSIILGFLLRSTRPAVPTSTSA